MGRTAARQALGKVRKNLPPGSAKKPRTSVAGVDSIDSRRAVSRSTVRHKLSVSIPAEMAEWVQAEANRLKVSVSFIFVDAVARARRQRAWDEYLKQAGQDDITEADVTALRDELRAGGVSV